MLFYVYQSLVFSLFSMVANTLLIRPISWGWWHCAASILGTWNLKCLVMISPPPDECEGFTSLCSTFWKADPVSESECQWPAEGSLCFFVVPFHGFWGCQRRPWCFCWICGSAILEGSDWRKLWLITHDLLMRAYICLYPTQLNMERNCHSIS